MFNNDIVTKIGIYQHRKVIKISVKKGNETQKNRNEETLAKLWDIHIEPSARSVVFVMVPKWRGWLHSP